MTDHYLEAPLIVFAISLVLQWFAAYAGVCLRKIGLALPQDYRQDFDKIQAATLTLLALIIGFSFSMAVTRYDQRKNYEAAEANAIGTAYVRADLLPTEDGTNLRALLKKYLDERISFYETRDRSQAQQIDRDTAKLQNEMWSVVARVVGTQSTPSTALAVWGINDVLSAQTSAQASWLNRIPIAAWAMMGLIAIACNVLVGYGERRQGVLILLVLPAIISIALLLIADIDSPRGGIIRILPENLAALSQSLAQ
jgi:hypothetical protein